MDSRIVPVGGTIGILGGGQLGRMMALAGRSMGLRTVVWDPAPGPAGEAADHALWRPYNDTEAFDAFVSLVDRITYEFENVDYDAAMRLAAVRPVFPPPELLRASQHRLREKDTARRLGLSTTPYAALQTVDDVSRAVREVGLPAVVKTVQGGYDGKGQARASSLEEAVTAFHTLSAQGVLIYEKRVEFEREVSVVVARGENGHVVTYPPTENHHFNGILDYSLVPAAVPQTVEVELIRQAEALADGLKLVGVMALEFFVGRDGRVLFNEMAPRPHNSGHWTIEAAFPSQFAQHMRAVAGWTVSAPRLLAPSVMLNLLGDLFMEGLDRLPDVLTVPGAALHWYGKSEMRPGRKVGHVTVVADTVEEALDRARRVKALLGGGWNDGP